ncbi:MAG: folate family ECF transporter S component [Christensenellales bacterium]|nr:folate family ECF transporter S component [Christensenellales bacterium]
MPQKNFEAPQSNISSRTLVLCALMTAVSVVLSRMLIPMPNATTRFSIEHLPIILSGIFFGPLAGGIVGFCADFAGCLFSAYGYNPIFCLPAILYGVFGGLFRTRLLRGITVPRLVATVAPPVVLGSIAWQSLALSLIYHSGGSFQESLLVYLTTRSLQFGIMLVLYTVILRLLFRSNIFQRMELWPAGPYHDTEGNDPLEHP